MPAWEEGWQVDSDGLWEADLASSWEEATVIQTFCDEIPSLNPTTVLHSWEGAAQQGWRGRSPSGTKDELNDLLFQLVNESHVQYMRFISTDFRQNHFLWEMMRKIEAVLTQDAMVEEGMHRVLSKMFLLFTSSPVN